MHKRNRGLLAAAALGLVLVLIVAVIVWRAQPRGGADISDMSDTAPHSQAPTLATDEQVDDNDVSAAPSTAAPDEPSEPSDTTSPSEPTDTFEPEPEISPEPEPEPEPEPPPRRGYYEEIPPEVRESMTDISMPEGARVTYDDLRYLTVYYNDFDGNHATGNIVVAKELADEVLDIFAELYDIGYPIECVRLIDEFYYKQTDELDSLDRASMGNNNTSSFCYRAMNSAGTLSQHAFGRAIDLNPKINPYVSGGSISPANAKIYADRSGEALPDVEQRAIIRKDDEVYKIFTSRGWDWGCEIWSGVYDYQHFQKPA